MMANQAWRRRLREEVAKSPRAPTRICEAAGLPPAWYSQMMGGKSGDPTDPIISKLLRFIDELGADPAYIFSGVRATPQALELLRLLQEAPSDVQASMLTILTRTR